METNECLNQFQSDFQLRLSPRTIKAYHLAAQELLDFTDRSVPDIKKRHIRNWLNDLSNRGYRPNTIRSKLIGLSAFFTYCVDVEIILENPVKGIPYPKEEEKVPYYLTREQLTGLRRTVEGTLSERALIEVLYTTGVRISELAAMKVEHINWSERSIFIPKGKGKKERFVYFTPTCAEYMKAYLESRADTLPYLFVTPKEDKSLRLQRVSETFQGYSKILGFHLTPHVLRHTFTAHLAQRGMPLEALQMLLGHTDPDTTRVYARLYDHAKKERYDEWM